MIRAPLKQSAITALVFGVLVACAQSRDVAVSAQGIGCAEDCARAVSAPCFTGICDEASGKCKVVPAADGSACDDGLFCTVGETCKEGVCGGGAPNPCGATDCLEGVCNEDEDKCVLSARPDDIPCVVADDLCIVGAVCKAGECLGIHKDCTFAPNMDECHVGACDPQTGNCEIIVGNDYAPCHELGPCARNQTCFRGACQGGERVDRHDYTDDPSSCVVQTCNRADGSFTPKTVAVGQACAFSRDGSGYECFVGTCLGGGVCEATVAVGAPCNSAADDCSYATCSVDGHCTPSATNDGARCDDRDTCTIAETCQAGACKGTLKSGVSVYFKEDFGGPFRWTRSPGSPALGQWTTRAALSAEWQQNVREPERDHTPTLDGAMALCKDCEHGGYMESPPFDTSSAPGPLWLTLWSALVHRPSGPSAGARAVISVFDGAKWVDVWGTPYGHASNEWTWNPIVVDIGKYKNSRMRLRIGFAALAAGAIEAVGTWYVDDVTVGNQPCAAPSTSLGGGNGN